MILALFLFEWRTALISLLTIPLSLMATLLVLHWHGQTINTMILAGLVIALGAVVDDAIIDVENIVRRLRQHRARAAAAGRTASVILEASLEVRSPIVYATLIIVAAAIPVFLLQGLTGAFFRPLAVSYALAIVASMVVALTVTPALSLCCCGTRPIERRESPLVRVLQRGYTGAAARRSSAGPAGPTQASWRSPLARRWRWSPTLGQSLFPHFKERDFLMHWVTKPGHLGRRDGSGSTTGGQRGACAQIPGVRNFGSHIGQAFLGDEVVGRQLRRELGQRRPVGRLRQDAGRDPGRHRTSTRACSARRQTYLNERIEEVLTGGQGADRRPHLRARPGRPPRQGRGDQRSSMAGSPERWTTTSTSPGDVPQIEVEVDLAKAAQYGLKPGDVRRAAATLVAGEEVGDIFRGGRAYDVVVWSTPEARDSVAGRPQPADRHARRGSSALGDVAERGDPAQPERRSSARTARGASTSARTSTGRDLGSVASDLKTKLAEVELPARLPRRVPRRVPGAAGRAEPAAASRRSSPLVADPAPAAGRVRQLAAGRCWSFLTLPFALVGGVLARPGRPAAILSLGSLVGLLHGARDRRAQRDPADQPLPAPRARGGRDRSGRSW